ncbi:class I SAM-dependent methyltransferase [candidate division WWE3 bacterium]|uniref:Class I SAM-dependent methyltransferase n=1 Tax=candidate division WWE3 bacterium TaxID=2053526 RepID=A0A955LJQ0_UNCKA|nr:class I SAM-dependent methyltransferase [candidate division WWE3 bacterium]
MTTLNVIILTAAFLLLSILLLHLFNTIVNLIAIIKGAPFVPSRDSVISSMIEELGLGSGINVVDIGSGDGRVVIALAKAGYNAHGIEINPYLVIKSRLKVMLQRRKNARIHWGDMWAYNLSSYDCIVLYGIGRIMDDLEKKLMNECRSGTLVLSNFFKFPNLEQIKQVERLRVFKV